MATSASPNPAPAPSSDLLSAVAVAGAPTSTADLSAPAQALIGALDEGLGQALGLGASLSSAGAQEVAALAGDVAGEIAGDVSSTVADIVGDVAQAIPVVGSVLKGMISLLTLGLSSGPNLAELCQKLTTRYPPTQTGSILAGGATAPADYFAVVHGVDLFYADDDAQIDYVAPPRVHAGGGSTSNGVWAVWMGEIVKRPNFLELGPAAYRSAFAMAWMLVLEGAICDVRDYDWPAYLAGLGDVLHDEDRPKLSTPAQAAAAWQAAVDRDRRLAAAQWQKKTGQRRGLTNAEVSRLRALRRGIEAAYGPHLPRGARSDGGAALWIAWLDLVTAAFRRGALSWDYLTWLLTRQRPATVRNMVGGPWDRQVETLLQLRPDSNYLDNTDLVAAPPTWIWEDQACAQGIVDALQQTINAWKNTIRPYYVQGQAKLAGLEAQGRAAGVASVQRRGHTIGASPRSSAASTRGAALPARSAAVPALAAPPAPSSSAPTSTAPAPTSAAPAPTSAPPASSAPSSAPPAPSSVPASSTDASPLLGVGLFAAAVGLVVWAARRSPRAAVAPRPPGAFR